MATPISSHLHHFVFRTKQNKTKPTCSMAINSLYGSNSRDHKSMRLLWVSLQTVNKAVFPALIECFHMANPNRFIKTPSQMWTEFADCVAMLLRIDWFVSHCALNGRFCFFFFWFFFPSFFSSKCEAWFMWNKSTISNNRKNN